jgi:hypothetical protein
MLGTACNTHKPHHLRGNLKQPGGPPEPPKGEPNALVRTVRNEIACNRSGSSRNPPPHMRNARTGIPHLRRAGTKRVLRTGTYRTSVPTHSVTRHNGGSSLRALGARVLRTGTYRTSVPTHSVTRHNGGSSLRALGARPSGPLADRGVLKEAGLV